jgi:hypothetical protein
MLNEIPFKFTFFYFFSIFFTFALRPRVGAACYPNGHADAGRCPDVRAATQTTQNEQLSASVWVAALEMPLFGCKPNTLVTISN